MTAPRAHSAFRQQVARYSRPVLVWLDQKPRWLLTAIMTVLVVAGLVAPNPAGAICLGAVVVLTAWLTYLSWPEGDRSRRVVRLAMTGLVVGAFTLRVLS